MGDRTVYLMNGTGRNSGVKPVKGNKDVLLETTEPPVRPNSSGRLIQYKSLITPTDPLTYATDTQRYKSQTIKKYIKQE